MGEANRDGVAEILLSIRSNPAKFAPKFSEFSDSEHLDLNLGLSLGGFYSQIPKEKPLIRTSSLNIDLALGENEGGGGGFLSLARSASLPTEAEQEMRKIKEIQAMKRMEVKRRLLEKQRNNRGGCSDQEGKLSNLPFEKLKFNTCSSTNRGIQGKWGRVLESVQGRLKPGHRVGICSRETQAQAYCVHRKLSFRNLPKLLKILLDESVTR